MQAFHHAWIFTIACSLAAGALLPGVGSRAGEVADASLEAEPHPLEQGVEPTSVPAPAARYPLAAGK